MSKTEWTTRWGMEVSKEPVLPGVYRRRNGGFFVRGSAKDPRSGRLVEVTKVVDASDPRQALAWLTRERDRIRAAGRQTPIEMPRFTSFAASLMEAKIRSGDLLSEATRELWADVLEDHLFVAPFADFYVDRIRTRDILDWRETIKIGTGDGEYSPHTANVWLRILRVVCNEFVKRYELERNPMASVELFDTSKWRGRITKEQPNSLTVTELPLFLALMRTLRPQFFAQASLGFAIGARPSSLRPLRRAGETPDYIAETGELILRRSHTRRNVVMPVTKNGEDVSLTLPADLKDILTWHIEEELAADDPDDRRPRRTRARLAESELLFPSGRTGRFQSRTALWKPFEVVSAAMKEATDGRFAKRITPLGMRRTNKDLMRAAGVRDIVAMAVSNHLDDEMHAHYSTVSSNEKTDALAKVVDLAAFRAAHRSPERLTAEALTT